MGPDATVMRRLRRAELPIDTVELARELIGRVLAHDLPEGRVSGRIVETEAYVVGDASGHAFHGPTPRNRSLFLERGHAYVYRAYGISYLLNVSSELPGVGAGVLLRALEPLEGIAAMMRQRGTSRILDLARGPAGSPQRCGSIDDATAPTCAQAGRSGSVRCRSRPGPSSGASGSV